METLHGRPLTPEELERIRQEIESFDTIGAIDEKLRSIAERHWPHLVPKLPPRAANEP